MRSEKAQAAWKAFAKVDQKMDFLSQILMEYADGLTPGNVAHHRAWLKGQAAEIQEIHKEFRPHFGTIDTALYKLREEGEK